MRGAFITTSPVESSWEITGFARYKKIIKKRKPALVMRITLL